MLCLFVAEDYSACSILALLESALMATYCTSGIICASRVSSVQCFGVCSCDYLGDNPAQALLYQGKRIDKVRTCALQNEIMHLQVLQGHIER